MMAVIPEQPETEEQLEGSASHEVGYKLIQSGLRRGEGQPPAPEEGEIASNGVVLTEEMIECAEVYADDFLRVYYPSILDGGVQIGLEERVSMPGIHNKIFGSPDAWLYNPKARLLIIWDYKYGHVLVDAFENPQGLCYGSGVANLLRIGYPELTVEIRIIQPRAYSHKRIFKTWQLSYTELLKYQHELSVCAYDALHPSAQLRTGKHCRFCDARYCCPAALEVGVSLFEMAMKPIPVEFTPEALGLQMAIISRAKEQLKALESGYEAQVRALITSGKKVTWWDLETTQGREVWDKPTPEVLAVGSLMGVDLKKIGLITPNAAKKAGMNEDLVNSLSRRNQGLKLVYNDGTKARKVFT